MGRANPYRKAILDIIRQEQLARPGCALVSTVGVDEDSRPYVHFSCLSHENASWRYYVHVYVDTELAQEADFGPQLSSRCPRRDQVRPECRAVDPKEDSPAPASALTPSCSGEERNGVADEVP